MLDGNLVFHKTALGAAEIASSARSLPAKLRRALILVDGEKSVADLAPAFRPGEIDAVLVELQSGGYVTLAGGSLARDVPEPEGGTDDQDAAGATDRFEEVRRRAMREISDRLGPNGDALAIKVERCATPAELRAALREVEKILASFLGAEYGRSFARKVGRDLV
jgi:hypothetical protein